MPIKPISARAGGLQKDPTIEIFGCFKKYENKALTFFLFFFS